jgi:putative heme-binding domain-containing protein
MSSFTDSWARASDSPELIETYRAFALKSSGNAKAGEQLFRSEKKLACENCHRITGAEKSGPNLDGIADKYSRRELIEHILRPSASIKPGYEQSTVNLRDGRTVVGRINRGTKSMVRLLNADGKSVDILRADIESIDPAAVSMMPDNVATSVSVEQFADLIAYLETLHNAVITGFAGPNQPIEVTRIERPVDFRPIHSADGKFANPVWCGALPGAPGQLIVLEQQEAKVWRLERTASGVQRHSFLDLGDQVKYGVNWGLVCLAFHPQFTSNRRYFLKHEVEDPPAVKTVVVERLASEDLLGDSGTPSRRLFEVEQPAFNHNGGCIAFGPDGMLYIGFGDGGFQRDPNGNSQNPRIAHGSMLRIDVDRHSDGKPYAIPPDNPF